MSTTPSDSIRALKLALYRCKKCHAGLSGVGKIGVSVACAVMVSQGFALICLFWSTYFGTAGIARFAITGSGGLCPILHHKR